MTINFSALTAANLRENRADLVAELVRSAGTSASPGPATVAELSALPGVTDTFVVAQAKAGSTLAAATSAHLAAMAEQAKGHEQSVAKLKTEHAEALKAQADAHDAAIKSLREELALAKESAGVDPRTELSAKADEKPATVGKIVNGVRLFAGCEGKDHAADWANSAALRACWTQRARGDESKAKAMFEKFAADSKARNEPYAEAV